MSSTAIFLLVVASLFICPVYPQDFRVMSWNTWWCGVRVQTGWDRVEPEISFVDPDIVLLQETSLRLCLTQLLSKGTYKECTPISGNVATFYKASVFKENPESATDGQYLTRSSYRHQVCSLQTVETKKNVTVLNVALNDFLYGMEVACGIKPVTFGWSKEDTIKSYEFTYRSTELENTLRQLDSVTQLSEAVLLVGGDFASPSTLDYVDNQSNPSCEMQDFDWPNTAAMDRYQLIDGFRQFNTDVKQRPGITFSPVYDSTTVTYSYLGKDVNYPQDRRDFIYYRAGKEQRISVLNATTYYKGGVGPGDNNNNNNNSNSNNNNNNNKALQTADRFYGFDAGAPFNVWNDNDWPSDHAAVIAEFNLP